MDVCSHRVRYIWGRTCGEHKPQPSCLLTLYPLLTTVPLVPLYIHIEKMDLNLQDHHSDICLCKVDKVDSAGRRLGRRLVVAFDGTQNQFGPESSHVVEFYSRIVKSGDQLAYYTSGIGTFVVPSSPTRRLRMSIKNKWASVAAHHFKSNLLSGYRFLSDKYEMGHQIFLLGFSRGAYQARVLAAMITQVGLLRTGNNEQIQFAFETYTDPGASKETEIDSDHPERGKTTTAKEFKKAFCHDVNIHFVGVWDTVSSVGLFRNKYYPGAELAENICFFRHALALDERRVKFLPEYIVAKKEWFSAGEFGRPRCKEVWFRGSHSDVGGGSVENKTSDKGAIPSRWMAYEAMLAGLEMTPFWGGIRMKDLEPNTGKDSMGCRYKLLEYLYPLIKWEIHSESHPPLLTCTSEEPPPRRFTRASHRKRPRQIFEHQKLHSSVCLHREKFPANPFAYLPDSWINRSGKQYGWAEVISLLRDKEEDMKDQAASASRSGSMDLPPPELFSVPSCLRSSIVTEDEDRPPFRDTVRKTCGSTLVSAAASQTSLPSLESFDHQSQTDSSSSQGACTSEDQSGVVHESPMTVDPEVITEPKHETAPPDMTDAGIPGNIIAKFTLPASAIELDLLDCDAIPALIAGVLRGTNVTEFLERLEVLAYTDDGKKRIRCNMPQFSSMLYQVCSDKKYAPKCVDLAIRVAYELWRAGFDLYDGNTELWKAILSKVENWKELRMGLPGTSSLQRAARLVLHKTKSKYALIEIKCALIRMFNRWQRSFTEYQPPAPVQFRVLLATALECNAQDNTILRLSVCSSPHFLNPDFTKTIVNRLFKVINSTDGEKRKFAMLCFCVLCAIDKEITFDKHLFSVLKQTIVELGGPMEELWRLVLPESPDMLHGFGGKPETMTTLQGLLQSQTNEALGVRASDCSWACDALDKALFPHFELHISSTAHRIPIKIVLAQAEGWDDDPDDPHALCCSVLIIGPDSVYRGNYVADLISRLSHLHDSRIPNLADPQCSSTS